MTTIVRPLAAIAAVLFAGAAWPADSLIDQPLESLLQYEVAGASRFAQPLAEAPSAVSVVTAEDIRRFGFRDVGEALASLRGVYMTDGRDYSYVGIRGFARPGDYNTRMLLIADGVRRNDPIYDSASVGHDAPIEIDWIKRLEFVPGPASALYGANAIFGVANAVLWSGADIEGSRVNAEVGSGNMARLGLLSGRRTADGGDWIVGLSAYGRRGEDIYFPEFDVPGTGDGWARGLDGERSLKAFAKANRGDWQFDAGFSSRRKSVPTAYYTTLFNAPGTFLLDEYGHASVGHTKALAAEWTQNLRLYGGSYRYRGEYVYAGLVNRDETDATWGGVNYLLTYTGLRNHKLLAGVEAQRNLRLEQRNFDVDPPAPHSDDRRGGSAAGIFIQDEWRIDPRWMTNLGLRADRIAGYAAVSPRAALIFHPQPAAAIKLIHSRAFRPPNAYERYYSDGDVSQKANPEARPEKIATSELVADVALSSGLRLSGSYYHYRLEGLLEQVTDPADNLAVFVNRDPIHARGVEVEAEALFGNGLRAKGSLARQRLHQSFAEPVNSPRLMGKLQVDGPILRSDWILGLTLRALGPRLGNVGNNVPGYVAGNLVVSHKGSATCGEWSLGIYNLSGKRHLDPASTALTQLALPQDGRQWRLSWKLAY